MATVPDAADEFRHEAQERAFRRNLFIVGGVHLAALGAFFLISKLQPKPARAELMWLDGGALGGNESAEETEPAPEPAVAPEPSAAEDMVKPEPVPAPIAPRPPSEIVLPSATPEPTPVRATPKPATPKPTTPRRETPKRETPKPKATPKTTPKATPKPPPKKATLPKADASSAAAAKSTPGETKDASTSSQPGPATAKAGSGSNAGAGKGAGKVGGGASAGTNEFAWYYEMLDDRFTSRWEQPLSIVRSAQQFVTTLKIRINKDGTVASREIANSSGNPVMDESVLAAARKVLVVDPLPAGLGEQTFDVNINFALDQGL